MSESILQVHGLTAGYQQLEPVLHQVDLDVGSGQIVGLVGMNGAGKTTLLRSLSGGLVPRDGSVTFQGENLVGQSTASLARSGMIVLPEGHRVLGQLTVTENLELAVMSMRRRTVQRVLSESHDLINELFPILGERRNQLAGLLSGGEQQMLSLARAIIQKPKLLLLDEPSLGLAPKVVQRIYDSLDVLRESGLAMLIVEQNSQRVAKSCDWLLVLRDGKVADHGAPAELGVDRLRAAYFG